MSLSLCAGANTVCKLSRNCNLLTHHSLASVAPSGMWKPLSLPMPSIPQLFGLWMIFRANFAVAALFENFDCPPEAKDGRSALQNSHGFPDHDPAVECDYPTTGSCFYGADGSLVTQSASPHCPDNLVVEGQVNVASESPTATDRATVTITTTPASSPTTTPPSPPPPPPPQSHTTVLSTPTQPPSTTSQSTASSTTVDDSGGLVTGGAGGSSVSSSGDSVTGGVAGSPTSTLSSKSPSPSASERGDIITIAPSKHVQPAAIAGAVVATAVVVFVVLAFVLIWLRRRRWRNNRSGTAHRYLTLDETPTPREKAAYHVSPVSQSEPSFANTSSHPDPGGSSDGEAVSELAPGNISGKEANEVLTEANEMLTQRLRRVEAQVKALLTLGIPETAPPEYAA